MIAKELSNSLVQKSAQEVEKKEVRICALGEVVRERCGGCATPTALDVKENSRSERVATTEDEERMCAPRSAASTGGAPGDPVRGTKCALRLQKDGELSPRLQKNEIKMPGFSK